MMTPNKQLIKFLQEIGDSLVEDGSMTHWEALARAVWKKALGFEITEFDEKTGKDKVVEYIPPDKAAMDKLFDHIVGKPKAAPLPKKGENKPKPVPLAKRVGSALESHLNEQGEKDANAGGKNKTRTKGSLSERVRDMALRRNRDRSAQRSDQESGVETEATD